MILGFNQPQLPVPFVENAPELMLRTARALADDPALTAQVTGPGTGGQSTEEAGRWRKRRLCRPVNHRCWMRMH
ncbi:Uncharacterised protein [Morganella morganii]|nr:Uncharacterised protein [Morganella morganii]